MAYCSLCTDTANYGTDTVSYGTDMVSSYSTDMASYGTDTVSYGTDGPVTVHLARRGFQDSEVFCILPPTLVYFAVLQPGLFSVYCLTHCTTTKTPFSELPQTLC